jgi:tRNA-dihydrouridine synthase B
MQVITAPMAGVTDYSFRKILYEFSPDIIFTEMVDVNALKYSNPRTIDEILKKVDNEAVQIFGSKNDDFLHAVRILINKGFYHIDINLGCPMKKIIRAGKGSALLLDTEFVKKLLMDIKKEFGNDIRLSIKIRTGYKNFSDPEFYVKLAEENELYQICIHGRTQEQMYGGKADWNVIKDMKAKYKDVRIIGNGDLTDLKTIKEKTDFAVPDGIMPARGLLGNPWLVKEAKDYFASGEFREYAVSREEIKNTLIRHINYCVEDKGEIRANLDMRKHIFWYLKNFENIDKIKKDIIKIKNIKDVLKYIADNT